MGIQNSYYHLLKTKMKTLYYKIESRRSKYKI